MTLNHLAKGILTIHIRKPDGRRIEVGTFRNLLLNGAFNNYSWLSGTSAQTFRTFTETSPNYEDLDGTWDQNGNTVTRASGSGTFPSSPSQIGNELLWEDGERCHVTARTSDTQITVSGPPRTIAGKTLRRYLTNRSSTSGSSQSKNSAAGTITSDLTAGTWQIEWNAIFDAAPAPYTLGSVMIGTFARVVLPAIVDVEEFDQLEMSYKVQVTFSGRETHTVAISDIFNGYPYRFATSSITGNGTKMTIVTSEAHNFLSGDEIVVDGAVPERHAITGISASGSAWTVTAPGHGLSPADTIVIENCTVGDYNGTWTVATAPDADTLTITNAATPGSASDGTVRLATPATYFNGTWTVDAVPDANTIEILTNRTGPAIDPGPVTTSPDEADLTLFGSAFGGDNLNAVRVAAWSEANAKSTPAFNNNAIPTGSESHVDTSVGKSEITSTPANDWTYAVGPTSAKNWQAGGSSVPRVKQLMLTYGASSPMMAYFLTFKTPQPKLSTHRLAYPSLRRRITRDLPNY